MTSRHGSKTKTALVADHRGERIGRADGSDRGQASRRLSGTTVARFRHAYESGRQGPSRGLEPLRLGPPQGQYSPPAERARRQRRSALALLSGLTDLQCDQRVDRLTTTLITKLLTNPLAQSRSTASAGDEFLASSHRPTVDGMEEVRGSSSLSSTAKVLVKVYLILKDE
jgi:hypothetical protein